MEIASCLMSGIATTNTLISQTTISKIHSHKYL